MKKIHYLKTLFLILITFTILSCDDKSSSNSGIEGNWTTNETLLLPVGDKLTVNFTANGHWIAKSGASWCIVSPASGEAGKNTLEIYATSSTTSARTTSIIIKVDGSKSSSSFQVKQNIGNGLAEDLAINRQVDEYLTKKYLWNDEYKTLSPDFSLSYDKFLTNTLMSMTTNTLDKKLYQGDDGKTYYSLFSYIFKKNNISSTRTTSLVPKEKEYNFGITGIMPVLYNEVTGSIFFEVQGVYKGSSAEAQGLKRGSRIYYIDNKVITLSNYSEKGYALIAPSSNITLKVGDINQKTTTINSAPIYVNPVILTKVINKGANQIGYLVYSGFDAGFDEELFTVFKEFKSQGVTDLILDLRYNGGGHVTSADLIASCVAGDICKNQTFVQYRYNKERMKAYPTGFDTYKFSYNSYANLNKTSLSAGALNLNRLYCIVSENTASSSELVINSLRGIDIPVILIGAKTHGKNVGMEPINLEANDDTYELAPITFQSYNAKKFSDYENGFSPDPDNTIDENDVNGDEKFDGYIEYADNREPLFNRAISLITGEASSTLKSQPTSRSVASIKLKALSSPNLKRTGMIKLSENN